MTIAKKHAQSYMPNGELSLEQVIQAAIDEATDNATLRLVAVNREVVELKEHIRQLDFVIEQHKNHAIGLHERIRQLEQERVPDGKTTKSYHEVAQRLYSLLDDIDTAGDIAKGDHALYRGIVERTQSKKGVFVISCDGYTVLLVDDSMLAAAPAQERV